MTGYAHVDGIKMVRLFQEQGFHAELCEANAQVSLYKQQGGKKLAIFLPNRKMYRRIGVDKDWLYTPRGMGIQRTVNAIEELLHD